MDVIYTLNSTFGREETIDEFESFIWTERFKAAGDLTLVVPATERMINLLKLNVFLKIDESDEVMIVESVLNEEGKLKVTGKALTDFLRYRVYRASGDANYIRALFGNVKPQYAVQSISDEVLAPAGPSYTNGIEEYKQKLPNLTVVSPPLTEYPTLSDVYITYGDLYTIFTEIAESYNLGFKLRLASAVGGTYALEMLFYYGVDRTRAGSPSSPVIFTPATDSLGKVTELNSQGGYKNVAYAFPPPELATYYTGSISAFADASASASTAFNRRVMMVIASELTSQEITSTAALNKALTVIAQDALINNNYTKIVDGEVVPQPDYVYGQHYKLGDIVELQGLSGAYQKARVVEYIRTRESGGESAYPTLSVVP